MCIASINCNFLIVANNSFIGILGDRLGSWFMQISVVRFLLVNYDVMRQTLPHFLFTAVGEQEMC